MFAHQIKQNSPRAGATGAISQWMKGLSLSRKILLAAIPIIAGIAVYVAMSGEASGILLVPATADSAERVSGSGQATTQMSDLIDTLGTQETATETANKPGLSPEPSDSINIYVYISGAVNSPGVVCLASGSRLIDAVESCGGLTDDAASDYVNLAALLEDSCHYYIPRYSDIDAYRQQGGTPELDLLAGIDWNNPDSPAGTSVSSAVAGPDSSGSSSQQSGFPVDINSADLAGLQTVPGIGPVTAQRIIDYRQQNGRFQRLEDLLLISGIGDKRLSDMRGYLTCR